MTTGYRIVNIILLITLGVMLGLVFMWRQSKYTPKFPIKAPAATLVQLRLESKMEADIGSLLSQLIGEGHYHVSVISNLDVATQRQLSVVQTPSSITTNTTEVVEVSRHRTPKSKPIPVPDTPAETIGLPGFNTTRFVRSNAPPKGYSSESLPGFPEPASIPKSNPVSTPNSKEVTPIQMDERFEVDEQSSKKGSGTHILVNETKTEQTVESNIKNMVVTVVIDSDAFKKAKIDKPDLTAIIEKQAVINRARGDILTISYVPFKESRVSMDQVMGWVKQWWVKWLLIGGVVAGFIWKCMPFIRKWVTIYRRLRRQRQFAKYPSVSHTNWVERWQHQDELVRQTMDDSPDQVVMGLTRWIEKSLDPLGAPLATDQVDNMGISGGEEMDHPARSGTGPEDQIIDKGGVT